MSPNEDLVKVNIIIFNRERREIEVKKGTRIIDILRRLNVNPVEVVTILNGEVVPEEEIVIKDSELEILSVVSGG